MEPQQKIYTGKTKDIYRQPDGNLKIVFKDDVTGEKGVVDPGANTVMGKIAGKGRMSLELTRHFFERFQQDGIPTHLVSVDLEHSAMVVREAEHPGRELCAEGGLEFVCRVYAYGSFLKRYGAYVRETLQSLDYLVEITLKDDARGDPLINDDTLVALGILNREHLESAKVLTRRIAMLVAQEVSGKGLRLVDLKIELGRVDGRMVLIDEVSADAMRVMDSDGQVLTHEELYRRLI